MNQTTTAGIDLDKPILTQSAFEEIAASWDGCRYDDAMIDDIGAALRRDFERLARRAEPSVTTGDERALFEAWANRDETTHLVVDLTRHNERYVRVTTDAAWAAWQARAALASPAVSQQATPEAPADRMKCDDCDGRGHDGDFQWQGHFQPPEPGICNSCGGSGWAEPAPTTQPAVSQKDGAAVECGDMACNRCVTGEGWCRNEPDNPYTAPSWDQDEEPAATTATCGNSHQSPYEPAQRPSASGVGKAIVDAATTASSEGDTLLSIMRRWGLVDASDRLRFVSAACASLYKQTGGPFAVAARNRTLSDEEVASLDVNPWADTTASASIDTPEFREMMRSFYDGPSSTDNNVTYGQIVAYIDSRAPAPSRDAAPLPAWAASAFREIAASAASNGNAYVKLLAEDALAQQGASQAPRADAVEYLMENFSIGREQAEHHAAALARAPLPANPWHDAVLAECMRIEAAYDANDPVATIKALINWYVQEASSVAETIKIHADEYLRMTCGAPLPAQGDAPVIAPWPDFRGQPIRHGDRLTHSDGNTFIAVRLSGFDDEGDAWRAIYDNDPLHVSRLCLQIGDKGRAVLVRAAAPAQAGDVRDAARYQWLRKFGYQAHELVFHDDGVLKWGEELDQALDVALSASQGKKGGAA